jgi:RNA polymerase sigma-70 factor (ECF subfamily)
MTRSELQRLADEDLMPRIADKDPVAFEIFYDRHAGAAYSLSYRIVGDRQSAEDVTQEALISIWRSGARFDRARGSVRAWTLGIVRNRAIDLLRRDSGRAPRPAFDSEELLEREPSGDLTDVEALRRETARQVRGAISGLPDEQSKVIGLAYFGGFSHSEIAKMLNEPLGTIKGRMRLGMDKIRASLAEGMAEGV